MSTTAPAGAAPAGASLVQHNEAVGSLIADFINHEAPLVSAAAGAVWNHFAPGLVQAFVPGKVITDATVKAINKLSDAVRNQVVAFSVPSGVISDIVTEIEGAVPGTIKAIEKYVDPMITKAAKALGVLPAAA